MAKSKSYYLAYATKDGSTTGVKSMLTSDRSEARAMAQGLSNETGYTVILYKDNTKLGSFKPSGKVNPRFLHFKKYSVKCDGKTFGPYATKAQAKKKAELIARVCMKPAQLLGHVGKANPKRKCNPGGSNRFHAEIRTAGGGIFASGGFKTKAAAKKWLGQYYSRGLLFGRSAFITDRDKDKIVHEKHYNS